MSRQNQLLEQLESARRILALYDSPVPDQFEIARKEKQREFIDKLEYELIKEIELGEKQ